MPWAEVVATPREPSLLSARKATLKRWVLGLFVPPRVRVRSRSEEITRAILVALIPLFACICGSDEVESFAVASGRK